MDIYENCREKRVEINFQNNQIKLAVTLTPVLKTQPMTNPSGSPMK